jgi:hypothetical protein
MRVSRTPDCVYLTRLYVHASFTVGSAGVIQSVA